MNRLTPLCYGTLLLVAATLPTNGQPSDDVPGVLARSQYDLAADGGQFLLKEVGKC